MTRRETPPLSGRKSERGNVFFTLFGAVAIIGVLGAGIMATMRGPLSTMVEVNRRTQADTEMGIAMKLMLLEAVSAADNGDCDGDMFVEPMEMKMAVPSPTNGGQVPDSVGSSKIDPWGTPYGYCSWDSGPVHDDAACGGAAQNRLLGKAPPNDSDQDYPVIALISAGPNQAFETTCAVGGAVTKAGGSDDIHATFTYATATAATGGLWTIKSGDPTTAVIAGKDIEVDQEARFLGGIDLSTNATSSLQLGAASMLYPTQAELPTCDSANNLLLRVNTTTVPPTLEICFDDGTPTWESVAAGAAGVAIWKDDGPEGPAEIYYNGGNVGIGTNNPDDPLDIVGNMGLTGDIELATGTAVAWTGVGNITATTALDISVGGGLNTSFTSDGIGINASPGPTSMIYITGNTAAEILHIDDSSGGIGTILSIRDGGGVGIHTNTVDDPLDVAGNVDATGAYELDNTNVLSDNGTPGTILVGKSAGSLVTGINNTVLGDAAAGALTTGTDNIIIGQDADVPAATTSNYLNIGDVIHGDISGKKVGIGFADTYDVTGLVATLDVNGDINATGDITSGADIDAAATITAGTTIDAGGNITSTGGDVISNGTVYINDTEDLEPILCDDINEKLEWDGGWSCIPIGGGGTGPNGTYTIEEVLQAGDDAAGESIYDLNEVAIGSNAPSTGGTQNLSLDVTGATGSDFYCDADGNNCFTAGTILAAATPGAPNRSVQFNSNGSFGGDVNFTFSSTGVLLLSHPTAPNALEMSNSGIGYVDNITISDPGALEGLSWIGTNWTIDVSPLNRGNVDGNLNLYGTANNIALWRPQLWVFDATNYATATPTSSGSLYLSTTGNGNFAFTPGGTGGVAVNTTTVSTGGEQNLKLDVEGAVGADYYCDELGNDCFQVDDLASFGIWQPDGTNNYIEYDDALGGARIASVTGQPTPATDWYLDVTNAVVYTSNTVAIGGSSTSTGGEADLELDVTGEVGAELFCDEAGNNCFDAADVTGISINPADDREVIFNSNGELASANTFVFTSAGRLGIGTAAPATALEVNGNITLSAAGGRTITTTGTDLVLEQTGSVADTRLRLLGIPGVEGIMIESPNDDLADIGFQPSLGPVSTLRLEHRAFGLQNAGNTTGELQWLDSSTTSPFYVFGIGRNAAIFYSSAIGMGDATPDTGTGGPLKLDVAGNLGAELYCDENGNNCFEAATAAGASPGAPDRGIQFNSNNTFAADANFVFTSTGQLGIGTSTPGARLTLQETGGAGRDYFRIQETGGGSTHMVMSQWSNVGIGTASPSAKLDVRDNHGFALAGQFINDQSNSSGLHVGTYNNSASYYGFRVTGDMGGTPRTDFTVNGNGNVGIGTAAPTATLDVRGAIALTGNLTGDGGDTLSGFWDINGQGGTINGNSLTMRTNNGFESLLYGVGEVGVRFVSEGGSVANVDIRSLNAQNAWVQLSTTSGALRLTDNGNVGINDTTPNLGTGGQLMLDVEGNVGAAQYCDENGNNCFTALTASGASPGAPDRGIQFNSGGAFTADANFVYTSSGNLGLGTSTPTETLDVMGNALIGGELSIYPPGNNQSVINMTSTGGAGSIILMGEGGFRQMGIGAHQNVAGALQFYTGGNPGDVASTSMIITSTREVGIGDTTPNSGTGGQLRLDVEGNLGAGLYCDENGDNCFEATAVAAGGVWEDAGNLVRPTSGTVSYASADFVFGSPQLADTGNATHDSRMFFDKSKSAFRAGYADGTQWDDGSVGNGSVAFGVNTTASGNFSRAFGQDTTASGTHSFASGYLTSATGEYSIAIGKIFGTASADYSMIFGNGYSAGYQGVVIGSSAIVGDNTAPGTKGSYSMAIGLSGNWGRVEGNHSVGIFLNNTADYTITDHDTMGLIGGKFMIDDNAASANKGCVRYNSATTKLEFSHDCSTYSEFGAAGAADPNRSVQFNSNGIFSGNSAFTYTSGGRLTVSSTNNVYIQGGVESPAGADHNTALGTGALTACTGASCINNTAIGSGANATGNQYSNTAIGYNALNANNFGYSNTAVGSNALGLASSRTHNTAMGHGAGTSLNGNQNVAIGSQAGRALGSTDVNASVFVGYEAGYSVVTSDSNTFVGYQTGRSMTSGSNNVLLGYGVGDNITDGSGNIIIGYDLETPASFTSGSLNIGGILFGDINAGSEKIGAHQYCDENLANCFEAATIAAGGIWEDAGNLIRPTSGSVNYASADFLFGSYQLNDTGNVAHDTRMFFDKSKSAFRAGYVDGAQWDEANVGSFSFAGGALNTAAGQSNVALGQGNSTSDFASVAIGFNNTASGGNSLALGHSNQSTNYISMTIGGSNIASAPLALATGVFNLASGDTSMAMGKRVVASGANAMAFGLQTQTQTTRPTVSGARSAVFFFDNNTAESNSGYDFTSSDKFAIIGGEFQIDDVSASANKGCLRYNSATTKLQFSHDCSTFTDMGSGTQIWSDSGAGYIEYASALGGARIGAVAGANAPIYPNLNVTSSGTAVAAGSDTQIQYNSGGNLGASSTFVYTSAGNFGLGTASPTTEFMALGTHGSGSTLSTAGSGTKMFWYPRKSAFRAGYTSSSQWDDANIGQYSFATGTSTRASGTSAVSMGWQNIAAGDYSTVAGNNNLVSGLASFAVGSQAQVGTGTANAAMGGGHGNFSMAFGLQSAAQATDPRVTGDRSLVFFFDGNTVDANNNYNFTSSDKFAIIGGEIQIDNQSSTANKGCIRYDSTNTKLQFSHDCSSYSDLGSSTAAGSTTHVQFNSGGAFMASSDFNFNDTTNVLNVSGTVSASDRIALGLTATANAPSGLALDDLSDVNTAGYSTGHVLTYNGTNWVSQTPAATGGVWEDASNVIRPTSGTVNYTSADFVFGSSQLDNVGSQTWDDARLFFDKDKAAFRAGWAWDGGTKWNNANIGTYSTAFGYDTQASGTKSMAWGDNTTVTSAGINATAFGYQTQAQSSFALAGGYQVIVAGHTSFSLGGFNDLTNGADHSFALGEGLDIDQADYSYLLGHEATITGTGAMYSMAIGLGNASGTAPTVSGTNSLGIFMGDQSGYNMTYSSTLGLVGGEISIDDVGSSANRGCIRYNSGTTKLQFSHDCATYADMGGGGAGAAGNDREIQFNSAGSLASVNSFAFSSSGHLGIGAAPDNNVVSINGNSTSGALLQTSGLVQSSASTDNLSGARLLTTFFGTSNHTGDLVGLDVYPNYAFTLPGVIVDNAYGLRVDGFKNGLSSTLTNYHGIYVKDILKLGTLTNAYGLYLQEMTAGTNNFTLYSSGGKNFFGGSVGIGTPAPTAALEVTTEAATIARFNSTLSGSPAGVFINSTAGQNASLTFEHGGTDIFDIYGDAATGNLGFFSYGSGGIMFGLTSDGAVLFPEKTTPPAISGSGEGKIYFDDTDDVFKVSENGGAWTDLVGGGGIWTDSGAGYIEYSSALGGVKVSAVTGAASPTFPGLNVAGGSGTAAGSTTQIQYNSGGAFAASSNFVYNDTSKSVTLAASQAALTSFQASNSNASGEVGYGMNSDGHVAVISALGTSNGGYGSQLPNMTAFYTSSPVGLNFMVDNTTGYINFTTGGSSSERMRLTSSGSLVIGDTTRSAGEQTLLLDVEGAIGGDYYCDADGNNCFEATDVGGIEVVSGEPAPNGFQLNDLDDVNAASPSNSDVLTWDGSEWVAQAAGGAGTPAGSDRQVQFNSNGAFHAATNFVYTSAGRLGIGTASPAGVLDVQNSSPGNAGYFKVQAAAPSTVDSFNLGITTNGDYKFEVTSEEGTSRSAMVFADGGSTTNFGIASSVDSGATWSPSFVVKQTNVGIGTAAPSFPLSIQKTGNTNGVMANIASLGLSNNNTYEPVLKLQAASQWTLVDGFGPSIAFTTGTGGTERVMGYISGVREGADNTGGLAFTTVYNGEGTPPEKMRIMNSGNVGIGTTAPASKLHIRNTTTSGNAAVEVLRLQHEDSDSAGANNIGTYLSMVGESNSNGVFPEIGRVESVLTDSANASKDGDLRFYTLGPDAGAGSNTATEKVRITSAGTVAIGNPGSPGSNRGIDVVKSYPLATSDGRGINTDITSTGSGSSYQLITGSTNTVNINASSSGGVEGYAVTATANAALDGNAQVAMGVLAYTQTAASDTGYVLYAGDANTSTGGTQFGLYINLDDTDVTRWGIYQTTANNNYLAGNLGIANSSPSVALDVTGDIEYSGTITDVSDIRLKDNITPLNQRGSMLDKLGQVDTYSFTMKDDEKKQVEFGVMAQEIEKIFPELVRTADDEMGTKSVNYVGLIAPMIEAGKELEAQNKTLKAEIAALKASQDKTDATLASLSEQVDLLNKAAGNKTQKAGMDIWTLLAMIGAVGASSLFFLLSGILKTRKKNNG